MKLLPLRNSFWPAWVISSSIVNFELYRNTRTYRVWQIKVSTIIIDLVWGDSLCNVLQWFIWKVFTSSFSIGEEIDCKWLYNWVISILVIFQMIAIFHQCLPNFMPISIIVLLLITSIDISSNSPIILPCKMVTCNDLKQISTNFPKFWLKL